MSFVVASNAPDGATGEILLLLKAPEDTFVDRTEYRLKLVVGREDEGAEASRGDQEPEATDPVERGRTPASDALLPTIVELESACAAGSRHAETAGATAADIVSAAAGIEAAREGVQLSAAVGEARASCAQLDAVKDGVVTSVAQVRSEEASAQGSVSAATASLASCESSADVAAAEAAEGRARSAARRAVASYARAQEGDDLFDRISIAARAALEEVRNAREQLDSVSISKATLSSQLDNAGRSRELAEAGARECRERQQSVRQQWAAAGGGSDAALATLGQRIEAVALEPPDLSWLDTLAPKVDAIHQALDADAAAINDALVELMRCANAGSEYPAVLDASEAMLGLNGVLAELDGLAALGESCRDRLEPGEDDTSRPLELVTVPDLTGQSKDLARAWIEELGLRAFLRPGRAAPTVADQGKVESQAPGGGSRAEPRALVTLVYYKDHVPEVKREPAAIDCSPWPGTRPVGGMDETGPIWTCKCPGEGRWTGSACVSPTEASRTPEATIPEVTQALCDRSWPGTILRRHAQTEAPQCDCPSGTAWSPVKRTCLALPGGGGGGSAPTPSSADCSSRPGTIRDPRSGECRCPVGTWNAATRSCVRPAPGVPAAPPGDPPVCGSSYYSIRRAVAQGDLLGAQALANIARQEGCDSGKVEQALSSGGDRRTPPGTVGGQVSSTHVARAFGTDSASSGAEYDSASVSLSIDPAVITWIAWNSTPDVSHTDATMSGRTFLWGGEGIGSDDFIRLTIVAPDGRRETVDMDKNDSEGRHFQTDPMNVIHGNARDAPDALRIDAYGSTAGRRTVFDESGAFRSLFRTKGTYQFHFSFRNEHPSTAGHGEIHLLVR